MDGVYNEIEDRHNPLFAPTIHEETYRYLSAIKSVCEQHGANLILIKIPNSAYPQTYEATWTRKKHDLAVEFAKKMGLPFIDFKYDIDCGIDYSRDSWDGGGHLNLNGTLKVTDALGKWISLNYPEFINHKNKTIEQKLPLYKELKWTCELQLENDFLEYLSKLSAPNKELVVFFSIQDTGLAESKEDEKQALSSYGFKTNFHEISYGDSFIAVVDNGIIRYECTSNRERSHSYLIDENTKVNLYSAGWECANGTSISINNIENAIRWRGLNIVVYDKTANMVIDSVCFDFLDSTINNPRRDNHAINKMRFDYQYYLYEHPEAVK